MATKRRKKDTGEGFRLADLERVRLVEKDGRKVLECVIVQADGEGTVEAAHLLNLRIDPRLTPDLASGATVLLADAYRGAEQGH